MLRGVCINGTSGRAKRRAKAHRGWLKWAVNARKILQRYRETTSDASTRWDNKKEYTLAKFQSIAAKYKNRWVVGL